MSYLKFDKTRLVNLEYALPKEILLANSLGVYTNTTLVGCNTRKYHGLLVVPVKKIDGGQHVLLSNLHETVIQHGQEFNLGIYKYPGEYSPKGHKYARWFESDPLTKIVYRVGGVVLQKEYVLEENEARILIRYKLLEAHSPTRLRLKPFLAFRSVHALSKANMYANTRLEMITNGIKTRLYKEYPELVMQTSKKGNFVVAPDWYYNIEYAKEQLRGYDYHEDLFVPGYYEMTMKKDEEIVFTAGLEAMPASKIDKRFGEVSESIREVTGFNQILARSANQFIQTRDGRGEILSGFPWFGRYGRFSLIPVAGLLLASRKVALAQEVLLHAAEKIKSGLFPDHSPDLSKPVYGPVDTSLWYIWAIQKLYEKKRGRDELDSHFKPVIKKILDAYLAGKIPGLRIEKNGLLHAYLPDRALTWMDSYVDGKPVTQRPGYAIEINALWYNAIHFAAKIGVYPKEHATAALLEGWKNSFSDDFTQLFWNQEVDLPADYVFEGKRNMDVRPNMVLAAAMPFSPFTDDQKMSVLDAATKMLLTPKGLRTLSPAHEDFKNSYEGDHVKRDLAYHQGTVWPWLFGFYAEAWLSLYGKAGKESIDRIVKGFEDDMIEHGICNISEVYDGSPPFRPCGAISFASSISEILRVMELLSKLSKK